MAAIHDRNSEATHADHQRRDPATGLPRIWSELSSLDPSAATTVHVIDDDRDLREALGRIIAGYSCRVEMHERADSFLRRFQPDSPEALVLDLGLPGMSGIDLLSQLRERGEILPTLVLSSSDDVESVVRSIQRGALDFQTKPPDRERLAAALERLLALAPQYTVERRIRSRLDQLASQLTRREKDVYERMLVGRTPKQIAMDLSLAPRTAHIHCSNVLKKFRVDTANDLLLLRARVAGGPIGSELDSHE